MRAVIQRVGGCTVTVGDTVTGAIDGGLLVYLGVGREDGEPEINYLAEKIANLRIFEDENGKMNLSALDTDAGFLVVSQFTLYADVRKGRRPSYDAAAPPDTARERYEQFCDRLREVSGRPVATGEFQAKMTVAYTNLGPVTIIVDTDR